LTALEQHHLDLAARQQEVERLHIDLARRTEELRTTRQRRTTLARRLDEARGDDSTVGSRLERIAALETTAAGAAAAIDEERRARSVLAEAMAGAHAAALAAGFRDVDEAASAMLDPAELEARADAVSAARVSSRPWRPSCASRSW
jgi:exonuclease SbcC